MRGDISKRRRVPQTVSDDPSDQNAVERGVRLNDGRDDVVPDVSEPIQSTALSRLGRHLLLWAGLRISPEVTSMSFRHMTSSTGGCLKLGRICVGLELLLAISPDARIVFTDRYPVKSMTSFASPTRVVFEVPTDTSDPFEIASD